MTRVRRLVVALSGLVAFGGTNACVHEAGARSIAATSETRAPHDVILVLAGGVRGSRPTPILEDRLTTALSLFRAGAAPKLLLTGDEHVGETAVMRDWLLARGVPDEALVVDGDGVDTYTSMYNARSTYDIGDALIVTQRFHLPRAIFIAQALGMKASGAPAVESRWTGDVRHPARELLARPAAFLDCALGRRPQPRA